MYVAIMNSKVDNGYSCIHLKGTYLEDAYPERSTSGTLE
jgi:hypothetical protein